MRISDWSSDVCSSDLQNAARFLDAVIDTVVGAARAPLYREHQAGYDWPDVRTAHSTRTLPTKVWPATDRTPVITAAAALTNGRPDIGRSQLRERVCPSVEISVDGVSI